MESKKLTSLQSMTKRQLIEYAEELIERIEALEEEVEDLERDLDETQDELNEAEMELMGDNRPHGDLYRIECQLAQNGDYEAAFKQLRSKIFGQ